MQKFAYHYLFWLALLINTPVFAEDRAVNVEIGSVGFGWVNAAVHPARKLIGQAIASGTIDNFLVYSPRKGAPIPDDGGLSACAEAGFRATPKKFNAFVKQLRSIRPSRGIFINVAIAPSCAAVAPLSCGGIAGIACPSNLVCVDDPKDNCDPAQGGADCSGICVDGPK